MYEYTSPDQTTIRRLADGASIPAVGGNRDYQEVMEWVAAGNVIAPYVAPPPTVPSEVSPYQARVTLHHAGLLSTVEAMMADPETPAEARIAWEYATTIQRHSAFIETLGPALGLTVEQIDGLFMSAAEIT